MCTNFSLGHMVGRCVNTPDGSMGDACESLGLSVHVDELVFHESGKCGVIDACISSGGLMYVKV